ncbi:MAG: GTP 3',8-cyclase MoaA [Flavisolibacter sp.]
MLTDNHGRVVNYVRIAVTDRCNLRCYYCMPASGLDWIQQKEMITYEEIIRICTLLAQMGIEKIRITGGEPFMRKDLMQLLSQLVRINGIKQVSITTNGVLTAPYIQQLKELGITSVNLSLDTLDAERFLKITNRNYYADVINTLHALLEHDMNVKINTVVMEGKNTMDIIPLCELTKDQPVAVRFIEEMPFNGDSHDFKGLKWDHLQILKTIHAHFPGVEKITDPPGSTSFNYRIPGYKGSIGIIAAYSRTFCGTCNRLRITPPGMLQTCLYAPGVLDIKNLIRSGISNEGLKTNIIDAVHHRERNGWEAQQHTTIESLNRSMAAIGG